MKNVIIRMWPIVKNFFKFSLILLAVIPWIFIIHNLILGYGVYMDEKESCDCSWKDGHYHLNLNDNLMVFWPPDNKFYPLELSVEISSDRVKQVKNILNKILRKTDFKGMTIKRVSKNGIVVACKIGNTYIILNEYLELKLRELALEE
ncbi:MAG: hypothetical protein V1871_01115 [Planctomycetota bacterium]